MSLLFSCPLNYPQTWFHTILTSKSRNRAVVKVKSGNPLGLKLKTSRKPRRTHHSIFIPQGKTPGRTKKWFLNCLWKYIKSMWVKFHCVSFIFEGSPPRRDCPRGHTLSFKWGLKGNGHLLNRQICEESESLAEEFIKLVTDPLGRIQTLPARKSARSFTYLIFVTNPTNIFV